MAGLKLQNRGSIPMASSSTRHSQAGCTCILSCNFRGYSSPQGKSTSQLDLPDKMMTVPQGSSLTFQHCSGIKQCQRKEKTNVNVLIQNILQLGLGIYLYLDSDKLIAKMTFFMFSRYFGVLYTQCIICWCSNCC